MTTKFAPAHSRSPSTSVPPESGKLMHFDASGQFTGYSFQTVALEEQLFAWLRTQAFRLLNMVFSFTSLEPSAFDELYTVEEISLAVACRDLVLDEADKPAVVERTYEQTHALDVSVTSQNRLTNKSLLSYNYNIHRNTSAANGAHVFSGGRTFTATLNGDADAETKTFDFRSVIDLTGTSGTIEIEHTSDGTKTIALALAGPNTYVSAGFPVTSKSGSLKLPQIIRNRGKVGVDDAWGTQIFRWTNDAWVPARLYAGDDDAWKEVAA